MLSEVLKILLKTTNMLDTRQTFYSTKIAYLNKTEESVKVLLILLKVIAYQPLLDKMLKKFSSRS
jgi:hypothetical protein